MKGTVGAAMQGPRAARQLTDSPRRSMGAEVGPGHHTFLTRDLFREEASGPGEI